jgi:hypothetical protein
MDAALPSRSNCHTQAEARAARVALAAGAAYDAPAQARAAAAVAPALLSRNDRRLSLVCNLSFPHRQEALAFSAPAGHEKAEGAIDGFQ